MKVASNYRSWLTAALGVAALATGGRALYAESTVTEVKDAATVRTVYDIEDRDTVTIKFDKGSSTLSDTAANDLKSVWSAARDNGKIKEILVLAYSDQNYPKNQKDSLPKADRDLADKRLTAVKDKLKDFGASDLKTYNMAEKSNWFEKTFVTSDAQVKREAREKVKDMDRDDAFYQILGRRLQKQDDAGTAVVVMRRDYLYSH